MQSTANVDGTNGGSSSKTQCGVWERCEKEEVFLHTVRTELHAYLGLGFRGARGHEEHARRPLARGLRRGCRRFLCARHRSPRQSTCFGSMKLVCSCEQAVAAADSQQEFKHSEGSCT